MPGYPLGPLAQAPKASVPNTEKDTILDQPKPPVSEAKHLANAENARKSTGPRIPQGKRKGSLNAIRSKLHCQIECLPAEDLVEIVAELESVGPSERFYAVAIAQSMWRLNHAMSLMQSIFAHGHAEKIDAVDTGNVEVDTALVAAQTFLRT